MSQDGQKPNPAALAETAAAADGVKKIQIYPTSSSSARQVTPFWREKYERDAKKYWDVFYRRHKDKFFKDRHYLDKEWGRYFQVQEGERLVVLEVGCGAGNTTFPLVSTYPNIFVHSCDFSPRAVDLVKAHKDFTGDKINAFVCDLTADNLSEMILPSSVDVVTMVFMLSAVAPEKMHLVLTNIRNVLKPNGRLLLRDYATGDLAQERLICKDQQIGENFYVRGDGTRAYYFSTSFLTNLFIQNGYNVEEVDVCNKQVENRSLELVMNRRWIQAVFSTNSFNEQRPELTPVNLEKNPVNLEKNEEKCDNRLQSDYSSSNSGNGTEIDVSETIAEMFGITPSFDEIIEIKPKGYNFRINGLAKEFQHTCKSTGLILWESARLMCNMIAENPSIVSGKRVLELGCGSAGICSMVAVHFAEVVVATDGDILALDLLKQNAISNLEPGLVKKMAIERLLWGNKEDIDLIKDLYCDNGGFEVIIGTDVTYSPLAISPLFETAKELLSNKVDEKTEPSLILCHIQRRVDEDSIISSASRAGFRLVDKWMNGMQLNEGILSSWISNSAASVGSFQSTPLTILYFNRSTK